MAKQATIAELKNLQQRMLVSKEYGNTYMFEADPQYWGIMARFRIYTELEGSDHVELYSENCCDLIDIENYLASLEEDVISSNPSPIDDSAIDAINRHIYRDKWLTLVKAVRRRTKNKVTLIYPDHNESYRYLRDYSGDPLNIPNDALPEYLDDDIRDDVIYALCELVENKEIELCDKIEPMPYRYENRLIPNALFLTHMEAERFLSSTKYRYRYGAHLYCMTATDSHEFDMLRSLIENLDLDASTLVWKQDNDE